MIAVSLNHEHRMVLPVGLSSIGYERMSGIDYMEHIYIDLVSRLVAPALDRGYIQVRPRCLVTVFIDLVTGSEWS
jgi:hypothetical protein